MSRNSTISLPSNSTLGDGSSSIGGSEGGGSSTLGTANLAPMVFITSLLFLSIAGMVLSVRKLLQVKFATIVEYLEDGSDYDLDGQSTASSPPTRGEPLPMYKDRSSLIIPDELLAADSIITVPPPAYSSLVDGYRTRSHPTNGQDDFLIRDTASASPSYHFSSSPSSSSSS